MSRLSSLVRTSLRVNFGLSLFRPKEFLRRKRDLWMVPLFVLGAASLGPVLYYYLKVIAAFYRWLAPTGQQAVLLTAAVLLGQVFILIFGFYYIISAFYFSRDLEILVPLPLTPTQVMLSKFVVILANEYLTVGLLVLPIFISYGVLERAGLLYWLSAGLVYLLLPVLPLTAVGLLVVVLMRVANFGRKKDALIIVGSLVLMTAALGGQVWLSRSAGSAAGPEEVARFLASSDGLIRSVGAKFPPSIWASTAMARGFSKEGALNALLFVGVSAGLFLGLLLAAEKLFYHGLVGLGERSTRRKRFDREALAGRLSSGRRPIRAVFLREFRVMNRTPIFLLNGVLSVVLIPVVFVLMAKTGSGQSDMARLIAVLGAANPATAALGAALFMAICACLNGTSSSTFSREGGQFWMSKVIPVAPRDQAKGKLLHSFAVALLGIAAASVVVVLIARPTVPVLTAALGAAVVGSFVLTVIGMLIDLARPLLDWTTPQKAIKQNLNVLLAVLADLAFMALMFFLVRLMKKAGLSGNSLVAAVFVLLAGLAAASYRLLLAFADKRYPQIE
jgi:ABC-2 type transport system permease protein